MGRREAELSSHVQECELQWPVSALFIPLPYILVTTMDFDGGVVQPIEDESRAQWWGAMLLRYAKHSFEMFCCCAQTRGGEELAAVVCCL